MNRFFVKFFLIIFLFLPTVSFAQVSKIIFTSEIQTIKPNTLSAPITIQTQDDSGNSYQTNETIDIEFNSSSPTGQFLNSAGNAVTKYISKNTSNRTFYYKDSSEGDFVLSIKGVGRDTDKIWTANQNIKISSGISSNNDDGQVSQTVFSISASKSNNQNKNQSDQLEVLTTGDKTIFVGSPTLFQAIIKKNNTGNSPEFDWSFGDGNVGLGQSFSHTYKYSGTYTAVLSVRSGEIVYKNKIKVKVLDPNIVVNDGDGYLEIINNGDIDTDLFNWKIEFDGKGFVFQPNTIISANSNIKIDKSLLKMKGLENSKDLVLKNVFGTKIFYRPNVDLVDVGQKLNDIKNDTIKIENKIKSIDKGQINNQKLTDETGLNKSSDNIIYESPKRDGVINHVFNFFINLFK